MQSTERWMPVVGYDGTYEVSNLGAVRSVDRLGKGGRLWRGQLLSQKKHRNGYLCVNLWLNGKGTMKLVHRLVLESHVGLPADGTVTCHNDGDATNNRVENLRWDTPSENGYDRVRHGTHPMVKRTHCPAGHLLKAPNLVVTRRERIGMRQCETCIQVARYAKRHPDMDASTWAEGFYRGLMMSARPTA